MTAVARRAAAPASPARRASLSPSERNRALRIPLCPSATLVAMLVCSVVVATAALWTTLAPRIGALHAAPAALAFAAAAALCAARRWRAQPRALEIGPDRIRAFDRDGTCVADGSLTGCVQWSTVFLVLTVGVARQRRTLVIAADAVAPEAFRELAVRGRCANGG